MGQRAGDSYMQRATGYSPRTGLPVAPSHRCDSWQGLRMRWYRVSARWSTLPLVSPNTILYDRKSSIHSETGDVNRNRLGARNPGRARTRLGAPTPLAAPGARARAPGRPRRTLMAVHAHAWLHPHPWPPQAHAPLGPTHTQSPRRTPAVRRGLGRAPLCPPPIHACVWGGMPPPPRGVEGSGCRSG